MPEVPSITDRLLECRTVTLVGEITAESCSQTIDKLTHLQFLSPTDPVKLLINSAGGDIDAAVILCDFMDHVLTVPIHGMVVGECSSAATFILLSCSVRKATPHSSFVIHSGTTGGVEFKMDKMTPKNLEDLLNETTTVARLVTELYVRKLNLPEEKIDVLLERGDQRFNSSLTAQEAKEIGLITEIVEGKLDIFTAN